MNIISGECLEWYNKMVAGLDEYDDYGDALDNAGKAPEGCEEVIEQNYREWQDMKQAQKGKK